MKVEGRRIVAANREILWSLLHDPIVLQRCWPGCETLEAVGPDEYRAVFEIRIGQVVERFTASLRLEQVVAPHGFSFVADGRNADGSLQARGRIELEDDDGGTALCYDADVVVTGRPAAVSSRLMMTTARAFARRGLDALEKEVAIRTRVYTTTTTAAAPDEADVIPAVEDVRHMVQLRRWLILALTLLGALVVWRGLERRQARRVARQAVELLTQAPIEEAVIAAGDALPEAA